MIMASPLDDGVGDDILYIMMVYVKLFVRCRIMSSQASCWLLAVYRFELAAQISSGWQISLPPLCCALIFGR